MATYFAENIDGTEISGLVRSYGNRYYKKPIIVDELRRRGPISVDWFTFAQAQTKRPVKGMITGPYTMMDWSFDEYYGSRADACFAFAKLLHDEAVALEASGAKVVQLDQKALTIFSPSKLLIDPDCGLKTRSVDEARIKLRNMVAAAHAVRTAHGLT